MTRTIFATAAAAFALTLGAACSSDDPSANDRVCDAHDDAIHAMETDATAVEAALDDLVAVAADADDPTLRAAGEDLDAARTDPALGDTFGAALADMGERCEGL